MTIFTRIFATLALLGLLLAAAPLCHADDDEGQRGLSQAVTGEEAPTGDGASASEAEEERGADASVGERIGRFFARVRDRLSSDAGDVRSREADDDHYCYPSHHPAVVRGHVEPCDHDEEDRSSAGSDHTCYPSHHPAVVRGYVEPCDHDRGNDGGGLDYDPRLRR